MAYWQQNKLNLHQYPSPVEHEIGYGEVPNFKQLSYSMHKHSSFAEQPTRAGKSVYNAEKQQHAAENKRRLLGSISAIFEVIGSTLLKCA
eukprot:CAMPEP_0202957348 /NCGR_PEP_ID=MMETSP1396-20130829/1767_1 /ASSEMBLY_ACC=CAM_ASM_000872 /TAXON_ID= /ORGANISM="Pseudokeronopsis sp., Strain Brazil" /LENGTH=89 /DNA_ID=CAMNT_0049674787 /DNA_START=344 /DNA_END=609 /DNA_ORIENTATION=+